MRSHITPVFLLLTSLLLMPSLIACGDEEPAAASCAQDLCSEGETRCLGNVLASCELLDGEGEPPRWRYESCGASKACTAGPSGQACETRKCTNLGTGTCLDAQTLYICDQSGLSNDPQDCASDEVCSSGACVESACEDGATQCGAGVVLTCQGGAYTATDCAVDEVCMVEGGEAACVAQLCVPESAWCEEGVAQVCNHDGTSIATANCSATEVCNSGFCEDLLCNGNNNIDPNSGIATSDAVTGDAIECEGDETQCLDEDSLQICQGGLWLTQNCGANQVCADVDGVDACKAKAAPPLEKIGVISFTLGGVPNTFDLNARADYISSDSMLKISGASGTRKIEMNFAPIELMSVGEFSDTGISETVLTVCYFDGGAVVESPGCAVGFSHSSSLYTSVIDEWNGIGASVVGTFETTLNDAAGNSLAITEGSFDVKQK
jgi:hypothetical protein